MPTSPPAAARLLLPLLVVACGSGKGSVEGSDGADGTDGDSADSDLDAEDIAQLCAEGEPEVLSQVVSFPATEPGCAWGDGGNLERNDAHFSARKVQLDALELPEDAIICDAVFDFEGINGGAGTPMVYDDNFVFTFNDVVLAGSYAPLVEALPGDGLYYLWDWGAVAGMELIFDNSIPTYCLGEAAGLASCEIPPPETRGTMSLAFDPSVVNELASVAASERRYEFAFITLGDNDDTDCFHEDFEFTVEIPYLLR